jgi:hypothetical protein
MERDKARKLIYIWSSSFDALKELSEDTGKPMTELVDEAVALLRERYPKPDSAVRRSL